MAHSQDATFVDRAAVWSLIVGALAFGVVWETSLFDIDIPWLVDLSIHGLSIATIAFGLIQLERSTAPGSSSIGWVGVTLTVIGTFASFVLLAVGLTLLAVSLWIQPGWRAGPAVLVVGSIALLLSYLLGARIGTEGAPDPSLAAAVLFGSGGFLIPTGLVLIGVKKAALMQSGKKGNGNSAFVNAWLWSGHCGLRPAPGWATASVEARRDDPTDEEPTVWVKGIDEPGTVPDGDAPDGPGEGEGGDPPNITVVGEQNPEGDDLVSPAGGTSKKKRGPRGGFNVGNLGEEEDRSKYIPESMTIIINKDHPTVASALGDGNVEDLGFRRLSYEIAFGEYSIALGYEMARYDPEIPADDLLYEVRTTLNRIARSSALLYRKKAS